MPVVRIFYEGAVAERFDMSIVYPIDVCIDILVMSSQQSTSHIQTGFMAGNALDRYKQHLSVL